MNQAFLTIMLMLSVAGFLSAQISHVDQGNETGFFKDTRDGRTYKVIKSKDQFWMAENLGFVSEESKCYEGNDDYCEKNGRLYEWESCRQSCPPGWRLPSKEEWEALIADNNGIDVFEYFLKEGKSGFDATLHGTYSFEQSIFTGINEEGSYWTASPANEMESWAVSFIADNKDITINKQYSKAVHACRCIKK